MRVGIGAVTGTIGGPATYAVELVRALVKERPETEYTVFTDLPEAFGAVCETVRVPLGSAWRRPGTAI